LFKYIFFKLIPIKNKYFKNDGNFKSNIKQITIVGNANLSKDYSNKVNSSDIVVRFNRPRTYGRRSGTRFDIWALVNDGSPGKHFAKRRKFIGAPYKDQPSQVWFPRVVNVNKEIRRIFPNSRQFLAENTEIDYSRKIYTCNALNQQIVRFSRADYVDCINLIRKYSKYNDLIKIPSTGFLVIHYILKRKPIMPVNLIGFSFKGWIGHPFDVERLIVERWQEKKLVKLLPT